MKGYIATLRLSADTFSYIGHRGETTGLALVPARRTIHDLLGLRLRNYSMCTVPLLVM